MSSMTIGSHRPVRGDRKEEVSVADGLGEHEHPVQRERGDRGERHGRGDPDPTGNPQPSARHELRGDGCEFHGRIGHGPPDAFDQYVHYFQGDPLGELKARIKDLKPRGSNDGAHLYLFFLGGVIMTEGAGDADVDATVAFGADAAAHALALLDGDHGRRRLLTREPANAIQIMDTPVRNL